MSTNVLMSPNTREMSFRWNDMTEASYRGKLSHIQNGYLKVWKTPQETSEEFNIRADHLFSRKINSGLYMFEITHSTFPA